MEKWTISGRALVEAPLTRRLTEMAELNLRLIIARKVDPPEILAF
jgi:hypothetical protein